MQMESVAPCRDREADEGAEEPLRTSCSGSKCSSSRQFYLGSASNADRLTYQPLVTAAPTPITRKLVSNSRCLDCA